MSTPDGFLVNREWMLGDLFGCADVQPVDDVPIPAVTISSLVDDSRAVRPGGCFVAVHGKEVDGHTFITAAVAAGARAIVVDRDGFAPPGSACVRVADTREALARLAAAYYGLRDDSPCPMRLIGITGTNGKTTTTWLLRAILAAAGQPTALIGTIEYDSVGRHHPAPLTTPGPLELARLLASARDAGAVYAVLEVSSHALDQRRCDGLAFAATVFTNLSGDHLDYHGTMERYAAAKRRLFTLREPGGVAVVNLDDPMGESLAGSLDGRVLSFGIDSPAAGLSARIEAMDRAGSTFVLAGRSFETRVRLSLVGRHNISNALAAAATADALDLAPEAILAGLERIAGVPGRLQRVEPDGSPFCVFVDYAHTDAALNSALRALRPLTPGRLICVFGCGGNRDREKRPRMAAVAARWADLTFVTSDNPRTEDSSRIIDEILAGFPRDGAGRVEVREDRRCAIEAAIGEAWPGDTVLIAGKGHETYQLVGGEVRPFDDVAVARSCLTTALAENSAQTVSEGAA